jgi:hypothetical protein
MAKKHNKADDSHLTYMKLPEFAQAKKQENPPTYLKYYSGNNYPLPQARVKAVTNVPFIEKNIIKEEKILQKEGWVQAKVVDNKAKLVSIEEHDKPVQLVVPKEKGNQVIENGILIWVTIKQRTKDGRINQVQFESKSS